MTDNDPKYVAWIRAGWEQGVISLSHAGKLLGKTASEINDFPDAQKWRSASDDEHIKPCVFCGSVNVRTSRMALEIAKRYAMRCYSCDAEGPLALSREDAIRKWNKRCF